MRFKLPLITVLGLLVFASPVSAASLSLSVAPSSTIGGEFSDHGSGVVLTTSATRTSGTYATVDIDQPQSKACEAGPDEEVGGMTGGWIEEAAPGESLYAPSYELREVDVPESKGVYRICGYIKQVSEGNFNTWPVVARAETTLTVTESRQEISERKRAQESAEQRQRTAEAEAAEKAEIAQALEKSSAEFAAQEAQREAACKAAQEREWAHEKYYTGEYKAGEYYCRIEEAARYKAELEARDQAQEARENAEWSALEAIDLAKPVHGLLVRVIAEPGKTSQNPGKTSITITTSPFARVTIKLHRYGHSTFRSDASPASLTSRVGYTGVEVPWTCKSPGGTYSYVITARTNVGQTLTRRGHFKPVSVTRCHALKRSEQEARERNQHQYEASVRRAAREEHERFARFESNCRKANGTPRWFEEESGRVLRCVAPGGGFLWVPGF
jgi:hypothetical protein